MAKRKNAAQAAVRQANANYRNTKSYARKLLKRANLDLKEYRKQLKTLQKEGVVSARVKVKQHKPTRYMLSKLRKFKGVAAGHDLAVPAKKLSARQQHLYTERGLAQRIGDMFIIPKTAEKQRASIHKDHIRTVTQLERGEEEIIKFPVRLHDMLDVIKWLEENEKRLNDLKGPRGQLGFQIFGHNAKNGFPHVRDFINYLMKYDGSKDQFGHRKTDLLHNKKNSRAAVQELVIIKFRPKRGGKPFPTMEPYYGTKRYTGKRPTGIASEYQKQKNRERQAKRRMSETKAEKEQRLAKQRDYDQSRSNDRRERRMAKKLLGD